MVTSTETPPLDELLASAQLPALPHSAITLLHLSQNPNNGPNQYSVPIEADPGLLGQVLKFVNSSYFGFSREIASVSQALNLVGVRTITNFALWNAVFSLVPNPQVGCFDLKRLWQDSLRRGLFSRSMGKRLGVAHYEDLFAGALLQDMAIPVLMKQLSQEYAQLSQQQADRGVRLSVVEREYFGWDHAEASAKLAKLWNLPEAIVGLIASHTQLDELLGQGEASRGRATVALSSLLPRCNDSQWNEKDAFIDGYRQLVGDIHELDSVLSQVDEDTELFAPLLKLAVPQSRLVNMLSA